MSKISPIRYGYKQVSRVMLAMVALAGFACTGQLTAQGIDTINTSGTNNVVVSGSFAYAAAGGVGLLVVDLDTIQVVNAISPPGFTNTICLLYTSPSPRD